MKKILPVLAVAFALAFFGCANSADTTDPSPAPTPVFFAGNLTIEDFEDQDLLASAGGVTGAWSSGTDSADGGSSTASAPAISDTPAPLTGTYFLKMNTHIVSALTYPGPADGYTATGVPATYAGYATTTLIFNNAANFTGNQSLKWDSLFSVISSVNYKVYIYNSAGQYIYCDAIPAAATWSPNSICFTGFNLPSAASYTRDDVLDSVKKIVWVVRYLGSSSTSDITLDFSIDNVGLSIGCVL